MNNPQYSVESLFYGIFMMKTCVVFSLIPFDTGKYDSVRTTKEILK